MSRETYVWDRDLGQNVPRDEFYARKHNQTIQSHLSAPTVIHDGQAPIQSMTNGRIYDSKAALRAEYKRAGVVEVGNEKPKPFVKPRPDRKEIRAAVERANSQVNLVS